MLNRIADTTPGLGLSRYALSQQSFTFNLSTLE